MRIKNHPVLDFARGQKVCFTFDGKKMWAYAGDTIASALVANGVTQFSHSFNAHRPRGVFCGIGRCCSCCVVVDGVPNVRACVTDLQSGMEIEAQQGLGDLTYEKASDS